MSQKYIIVLQPSLPSHLLMISIQEWMGEAVEVKIHETLCPNYLLKSPYVKKQCTTVVVRITFEM